MEKGVKGVASLLPRALCDELCRLAGERGGIQEISELRLRADGVSLAVISGERVRLFGRITEAELSRLAERLTDGALYSHRDTIASGYIPLPSGVRVGVSGSARYDGGRLVGVSNITSLVFRIPTGELDCADELLRVFSSVRRGAIIYSPPGVGKTSALRALARGLSKVGEAVAVVDERCEITYAPECLGAVDALRGFHRADGIEIALRTLAPTVILVDEVGTLSEAEAMTHALASGVRVALTPMREVSMR